MAEVRRFEAHSKEVLFDEMAEALDDLLKRYRVTRLLLKRRPRYAKRGGRRDD